MKRYLVLLALSACGAFGASGDDDSDGKPPVTTPATDSGGAGDSSNVTADGGDATPGDDDDGGVLETDAGLPIDAGTPTDSGGLLAPHGIAVSSAESSKSIALSIPASAATGDLLVAVVDAVGGNGAPGINPPPGWQTALSQTNGNHITLVWTRLTILAMPPVQATAGIEFTGTAFVAAYGGADGTIVPKQVSYTGSQANKPALTSPARDTAVKGSDMYLLVYTGTAPLGGIGFGTPAGFTLPTKGGAGGTASSASTALVSATSGAFGFTVVFDKAGQTIEYAASTIITIRD